MTTPRRPKRLQTTTLAQLLARDIPPRPYLLEPWLRASESALLWAAPGVGKTMLVLTLALAVAGGGEVCGWRSEKPRKVLLVDGEMHIEDLRDRLAMLHETVAGISLDAAGENLVVLSRQDQSAEVVFPDLAESKMPPDVSTKAGQEVLFEQVRRCGAELVILDNLSTLAEVSDENEASAMTPILTFLMRLKQAGVACILVHHASKAGNDYRGSSKLATTFEAMIGLKRLEGHQIGDGAAFELTWGKYRGRPSAATRDNEMRLEETPEGVRWGVKTAASAAALAVVEAIRSCQYATQREVAAALGMTELEVSRLKARAIGAGLITAAEVRSCMAEARPGGGPEDF